MINGGAVLSCSGVTVTYGRLPAVRGITFEVLPGEIVAFIGSNGAGKSSLVNGVAGLVQMGGRVSLCGEEVHGLRPEKIANLGCRIVPEGRRLFPGLTVEDNLLLGCSKGRRARNAGLPRIYEMFPELVRLRKRRAWSLSGGEQQMVTLGRAVMGEPSLILMDEPTLGLAPIVAQRVLRAIQEIRRAGAAIVLVEQNTHAAIQVADRTMILKHGEIVRTASKGESLGEENLIATYLDA